MKENHKIILCQGIQGSGKSTWARAWAQEKPEERVRWNNDDFRTLMGQYWVPSRETIVKNIRSRFMFEAMEGNYDIVVDDMNLNPKTINWYEAVINTWNKEGFHKSEYELELHLFNTPLEICIERDSKRPNPIGAKVITETYNRYKEYIDNNRPQFSEHKFGNTVILHEETNETNSK